MDLKQKTPPKTAPINAKQRPAQCRNAAFNELCQMTEPEYLVIEFLDGH